jgi:pyruvate kinase
MITKDAHDIDDMAERACQITLYEGFAISGERILIVAGVPFGTPGATNMIRLAYI